jgi:hypothetical protein
LDEAAEQYVRLALRLAQHQPSLVEAWNGPPDWLGGSRQPVAPIRAEIESLRSLLQEPRFGTAQPLRYRYLSGQLAALNVAARRLSGESMTFADEAREALSVSPSTWRAYPEAATQARAELERLLPGRGPLHDRVGELRRRHSIPPDRLSAAFTAAVDPLRNRVKQWVTWPGDEQVSVSLAADVGAEARAIWAGGPRTEIRIDERAAPDIVHLVWLAAHETYAGHHLQHILVVGSRPAAAPPIERQLQPAFGPHQLHAEGAAEAGALLLLEGSILAEVCHEVCRVARLSSAALDELIAVRRAMLALDLAIPRIAEAYLDGAIGRAEAAERLAEEGLVADPDSLLRVIERQRARLLVYPVGRRVVTRALGDGSTERRWQRLRDIATTLVLNG